MKAIPLTDLISELKNISLKNRCPWSSLAAVFILRSMAIARRHIVYDGVFTHLIFRFLNREFLFKDSKIKDYILATWLRDIGKYAIKIFDFCILDNHIHLIVQNSSTKLLSAFMRTTNALIATFVNRFLGRDSHALRERYKSPVIDDDDYFTQCQVYVWTNYFKATGIMPLDYKYCSAFYRGKGLSMRF